MITFEDDDAIQEENLLINDEVLEDQLEMLKEAMMSIIYIKIFKNFNQLTLLLIVRISIFVIIEMINSVVIQ
jgi:hypothetical protein